MAEGLGLDRGSTVFIGGRPHPPEERIVLGVHRSIVRTDPALRLILVPRRPERFDEVEAEIRAAGFRAVRRSRLPSAGRRGADEVLLVDTIGELNKIYAVADMVFVGGTLVRHGGQNMMEPAGLGKAVLFGPSVENFQDSADLLIRENAAIRVEDAADLERVLRGFLRDPEAVRSTGGRARNIVRQNQGASRRNLDFLEERFRDLVSWRSDADIEGQAAASRVPQPRPS
jgi:3-deoxy-D-manno-octulosonic-acid transferase